MSVFPSHPHGLLRQYYESVCAQWQFVRNTVSAAWQEPWSGRMFIQQWWIMAVWSMPVMALTAWFAGMVLALQSASVFQGMFIEQSLPHIVALALTRELIPVMTGLMMAGRWGSAITAELATMRLTEQIDALTTLSTNPLAYLVWPRIIATTIALPLLVLMGMVVGIVAGGFVVVSRGWMVWELYSQHILSVVTLHDITGGVLKALIFGHVIGWIASFQGCSAKGGTEGIGRATTSSVVAISVIIFVLNYLLSRMIF